MNNIACFNELSINPLCSTEAEADQRIKDFVSLLKEVRNHTNITKVRAFDDMTNIPLKDGMSMWDYCCNNSKTPQAQILFNMIIHPQVDMDDDSSLQKYIDTNIEIYLDEDNKQLTEGFNAAYCQNTFCIGFESSDVWSNDFYYIIVSSNGKIKNLKWACISSLSFYNDENRKSAFDKWLQGIRPITLVNSNYAPTEKQINLRDDHGKDVLTEHAKRLCNHPNVDAILTSLFFKPHKKDYIDNVTDDGLVDVVLFWEDKGYSMRIKTTGRNAAETAEIARILKEEYGHK